jgi:DNA-binding transcriptional LysR family regulator
LIEFKHLRYAEVAERCGSFRKAADVLVLKQSNLSRRAIVTGEPASDCNRSMALWSERIIVALPEDHPLAANEIIYCGGWAS